MSFSMQHAYIGLWEVFQVPAKRRVQFLEHIAKNRGEWKDVESELLKRVKRGDTRICGMGFVDEVRRERKAEGGDDFVVNNNHSSMYCRLFVLKYPEYRDRFEFRKLKEAA